LPSKRLETRTLIRWVEAPASTTQSKHDLLFSLVDAGESVEAAAKVVGVGYSTATSWCRERRKGSCGEEHA
jgi:transposase